MAATETVASLIRRARRRLDEPLDPSTNFWANSELIEHMNEGLREVWQTIREAHEDRFVRTLRSDQGTITLAGRSYDCALFGITSARGELILPPDFHELLLFEEDPSEDGSTGTLCFQHAKLSAQNFRNNVGRTSSTAGSEFFYNIEWRDGAAVMLLVPTPAVDSTRIMVMKYVQAVRDMRADETFEDTGFEPFMLDAVLAFIKYRAFSKAGDASATTTAFTEWETKRTFALRACGPRQTRDAEYIQGAYEEEWD